METQPFIPSQPSYVREKPSQSELSKARFLGRIKLFCPEKGYGYIIRDDKTEIRFQTDRFQRRVSPYTRVSFSVRNGFRGPEAYNIVTQA